MPPTMLKYGGAHIVKGFRSSVAHHDCAGGGMDMRMGDDDESEYHAFASDSSDINGFQEENKHTPTPFPFPHSSEVILIIIFNA